MSSSMAAVSLLSKAGGMADTETEKSTISSSASMTFLPLPTCISTPDTSQVQVTQLTDPLEEYTLNVLSSFHQFHSQKNYSPSLLTTMFQLLSQSPGMANQLLSPSNAISRPIPLILNQSLTGYHLTAPTTINPILPLWNQNDIPDRFKRTPQPWEYPSSLALHPSQWCLHCLAHEHLIKWRPASPWPDAPYLSEDDLTRVFHVLSFSWADKTLETYGSGLLLYHIFCDVRNIPDDARCPASTEIISSFLATMAGNYASGTLSNYLHGLRAWHILHGLPWLVNKTETSQLITAALHLQPPHTRKKPCLPYTCNTIVTLLQHLNLSLPLNAAVAACLMTTFYSAAQLDEFMLPNLQCFNPDVHCKRSNVQKVLLPSQHVPLDISYSLVQFLGPRLQQPRADGFLCSQDQIQYSQ